MPTILQLDCGGRPPRAPWRHCTGLRAAVLHRYTEVDPALGKALHDDEWRPSYAVGRAGGSAPKPYWISPLWPGADPGSTRVKIGLCCDELVEPLIQGLELLPVFELGRDCFVLRRYEKIVSDDFEVLAQPPEPLQNSWRFEFVTPVAHHKQTGSRKKNVPILTPESCWRSWLVRWNIWAPRPMPEELAQSVSHGMELVDVSLKCETVCLKPVTGSSRGESLEGSVGQVVFRANSAPPDLLRNLNTLARFAPYCGTGREHARGCGITRFYPDAPPETR